MINMKQSDFDRLKAVCEKEGFELLNESANDNDKFFVLKKAKDIWEGVEFALSLTGNEIFRMDELRQKMPFDCITYNFKPSTESAYIEQLKAETFKRFGEIKEGDRFDLSVVNKYFDVLAHISFDQYESQFDYQKSNDTLFFYNLALYQKGKWATRVKERVKVEPNRESIAKYVKEVTDEQRQKLRVMIASKLEEYLNKESE